MAEQKLVATGECKLGTGDMFELAEKAKLARHVLQQAEKEIQKTFPDFKFICTTANYRDPNAGTPGRKSAAQKEADAAAAAAAEAAKANGAGEGAGATA